MQRSTPPEPPEDISLVVTSHSAARTFDFGCSLGGLLRGGDVVALEGGLASGKTTLTRGLVRGLGCPDADRVNSPTYVLEQVYDGRCRIHHFDAYRLTSSEELLALGFDDRLEDDRIVVVEWADRVEAVLPTDRLRIRLEFVDGEAATVRRLTLHGPPPRWADVLGTLNSKDGS